MQSLGISSVSALRHLPSQQRSLIKFGNRQWVFYTYLELIHVQLSTEYRRNTRKSLHKFSGSYQSLDGPFFHEQYFYFAALVNLEGHENSSKIVTEGWCSPQAVELTLLKNPLFSKLRLLIVSFIIPYKGAQGSSVLRQLHVLLRATQSSTSNCAHLLWILVSFSHNPKFLKRRNL